MKRTVWGIFLSCLIGSYALADQDLFTRPPVDRQGLKEIALYPVQVGGRIKPLETYARETVEILTGKEKFRGRSALEVTLSMIFEPQTWQDVEFIHLRNLELRKSLGLSTDSKVNYFSPKAIGDSPRLMAVFQELRVRQDAKKKLDAYFQAAQQLGFQLQTIQDLISGESLRLVPQKTASIDPTVDPANNVWVSLANLEENLKLRFTLIAATFVSSDPAVAAKFPEHVQRFAGLAREVNPAVFPPRSDMEREVRFNHLRPFRWAWIFALIATIFLTVAIWSKSNWIYGGGILFFVLSTAIQIYGFTVRCMIAGRPPVSNMYESVIWVAFGCMVFGFVFEMIYRKRIVAIGALVFSVVALIIADNVSGVLDDSLHPLEAVLRSNYWLTVHVLSICLGYAAFALSLGISNIAIGQFAVIGRESSELQLKQMAFYAYRAVQVGVVLLAAGTILGGIWADESWGRFWGWDPKETWALIALLGYLALIHARFRGLLRPFGFLSWCVLSFLGVLMSWYGVNFVLGEGKHSYGFSTGGVEVMATFTTAQLAFVAYCWFMYRRSQAVTR